MSNIKKINIRNFKNLEDITIDIKPLNFLFGPNSSGKSSLLKALMFLIENTKLNMYERTKYNMKNEIDLISYKDIVSGNNIEKEIFIDVEIEGKYEFINKNLFYPEKFKEFKKEKSINHFINRLNYGDPLQIMFDRFSKYSGDLFDDFSSNQKGRELKKKFLIENNYNVKFTVNFKPNGSRDFTFTDLDSNSHISTSGYLNLLNDDDLSSFFKPWFCFPHFEFSLTEGFNSIPFPSKSELLKNKIDYEELLKVDVESIGAKKLSTKDFFIEQGWLINKNPKWLKKSKIEIVNNYYKVLNIIFLLTKIAPSEVKEKIFQYRSIPAIRTIPKNKYLLSSNNKFQDKVYYNLPNYLVKVQESLLKSKGIKRKNLSNYKFKDFSEKRDSKKGSSADNLIININKILKDFEFSKRFFIFKNEDIGSFYLINKDNKIFNLANESSGLIQILPVIAACSVYKEIQLIEQPELHLHPKLQAKLADVFSNALKENSNIIVETHSEHLIRKIQVLIARGKLDKEKIGVYYFDNKDGKTKIKEMEINDDGFFKETWPDGFFDDSYNLSMELLASNKD